MKPSFFKKAAAILCSAAILTTVGCSQKSKQPENTEPPESADRSDIVYSVREAFNDTASDNVPLNWTVHSGDTRVVEYPNEADKSLKLSGNTRISKDFDAVSGRIIVFANLRVEEGSSAYFSLEGKDGNTVAKITLKDGKISSDGGVTSLANCESGIWYNIRLALDTATGLFDLYIDGVRQLKDQAFNETVDSISAVTVGSDAGVAYIDQLHIYKSPLQSPQGQVFDVKNYGAVGDGITDDTKAIQDTIDACTKGGTVLLEDGVFLSRTIKLKGDMTFFIDTSATLKGSNKKKDYPELANITVTKNYNQKDVNRALVYADTVENLIIDGGGTIDCDGNELTEGKEKERPSALFIIGSKNIRVSNIYITRSAMWTMPIMSSDNVYIRDITMYCPIAQNRDGIDICDCHDVLIENCSMKTDDDVICLKSGDPKGIDNVLVRNCMTSSTRANGIKFGTLSYGPVSNVTVEDCLVKDVKIGALNVESVDGSDVKNFKFNRIVIQKCALPFYVVLSARCETPTGQSKRTGSVDTVVFENITGDNFTNNNGCYISGYEINNEPHRIQNIVFRNCDVTFAGGVNNTPGIPREFTSGYPESTNHGTLPAYGLYIRHTNGIIIENCDFSASKTDSREALYYEDDVHHFGKPAGNIEQDGVEQEINLAFNRPASSKYENPDAPSRAVDGDSGTRWGTPTQQADRASQWLQVDLGEGTTFNTVVIEWEVSYAREYKIQISNDGVNFTDVAHITNNTGGKQTTSFDAVTARYIRMQGIQERGNGYGYSIWEFEVYLRETEIIP